MIISSGFSKVSSLGIVRDADEDPIAAFQSVCTAIKNADTEVKHIKLIPPKKPLEFSNSNPKIAIMIIPNINSPGRLEDICLKAVEDDPAISCVDDFFNCLQQKGLD